MSDVANVSLVPPGEPTSARAAVDAAVRKRPPGRRTRRETPRPSQAPARNVNIALGSIRAYGAPAAQSASSQPG